MKGSRMANEDPRLMTGLFPDRISAERAYGSLTERGYTKDDVSLPPRFHSAAWVSRITCAGLAYTQTRWGSKVARSRGATSSVSYSPGANLSMAASERWPASFVSVYMPSQSVVPGLPIIAMGTLAAALTGAVTGGGIGAIIGALLGHGIPRARAESYDAGIRRGGIVMGVTPRTRADTEYLEREWTACGGEQLYCPTWRARDAA